MAALLALSTSVVWAFAFPLIKLGIREFQIAPDDIGSKTLFAGVRFFAAGVVVSIAARMMNAAKKQPRFRRSGVRLSLLLGLVNTALHYFFYYIGLSNQSGSRSAVIDSMSSFLLIPAACIVFEDEHFTRRKAAGCLLGLAGILTVNAGGGLLGEFTLAGDGMLILSAVFSAAGGVLTRIVSQRADIFSATGVSLWFGGLLMMLGGLLTGGRLSVFTPFGVFVLCCLAAISVYGFSVYNMLLACNPVGQTAIFNSLIPIFGVTFSCIILHEPYKPQYIAACILAASGIYVINSEKDKARNGGNKAQTQG